MSWFKRKKLELDTTTIEILGETNENETIIETLDLTDYFEITDISKFKIVTQNYNLDSNWLLIEIKETEFWFQYKKPFHYNDEFKIFFTNETMQKYEEELEKQNEISYQNLYNKKIKIINELKQQITNKEK